MLRSAGIVFELCRHEWIRERRLSTFAREMIVRCLKVVVWLSACVTALGTMRQLGSTAVESMPYLLIADQLLRWMIQQTPEKNTVHYRLVPVRKWHMEAAYALRLTLMPMNFMWLPVIWPKWWLVGVFVVSGYLYLWCWRAYQHCVDRSAWSSIRLTHGNGFLAREFRLRFRPRSR